MNQHAPVSTSRLANEVARAIHDGFAEFHNTFHGITRQAGERFACCDWRGLQNDARRRLDVRDQTLKRLLERIREILGDRLRSRMTWVGIKAVYSGLIEPRDDWELAETFFNSATRRVFTTVGIDPEIEFVHTDYATPPTPSRDVVYQVYQGNSTRDLFRQVLEGHPQLLLSAETIRDDSRHVEVHVDRELGDLTDQQITTAEFVKAVFYRGDHAYLMGRIVLGSRYHPIVICLTHGEDGPHVDAVLLEEHDVSLLFSFTRSYFLVEVERPYDMVVFINTLIPRKKIAEIYISLGYNKHGKTELYRNALRHYAETTDKYQLAEGQRGMVMVVFTMPSYPVVFKVIRDQFDYPKECSRSSVIDRYHLIFKHDRAGRLVDAQEYEYLVLDRSRFADEVLDELNAQAGSSITVGSDGVVIKHCYAERRVVPLNVYLQQADDIAAQAAVVDYGRAIKDLALTNLFPGDLLPKNFGVTSNGRVVFYDYDEVCLLTGCNFMSMPTSDFYDELAGEPWFGVGANDIFPEEFVNFLGLPPPLKRVFLDHHGDLLDAEYWNNLKRRLVAGELFHVPPYAKEKRLGYRKSTATRKPALDIEAERANRPVEPAALS